jgi:hypothetical protein
VGTGQNYMIQQKISSTHKNIQYSLSVQVSLTGLSFLVKDLSTQESLYFSEKRLGSNTTAEVLLIEIEGIVADNEMLQLPFKEVIVLFSNNMYTCVPSALFDETKAIEYLKFNSKILANDFIAVDPIDNHDMVVVYIPYVNINNYFFERFGSFQYYHVVSVFLKEKLNSDTFDPASKMFLNVQEEQLDVIVLVKGKVMLCNSFIYKTPEDFIYYILFCLEQLNLNPDTIPLIMSGAIEEKDLNYEMLFTYVRNISFVEETASNLTESTEVVSHKNYLLKKAR